MVLRLLEVLALTTVLFARASLAAAPEAEEPRYLLFQLFTASASTQQAIGATTTLEAVPARAALTSFARDLKARIGATGDAGHRLGFTVGPIALDHTDAQVRQLITDAFAVARELDLAVAFHLDDSMFWTRNPGLRDARSVEAIDWAGTRSTGRRVDWGPTPTKLGPQLCFNSEPVLRVVRERASLIGRSIERELQKLKVEHREALFAGVIAGWETMLGRDFDTDRATGSCALSKLGFGPEHAPGPEARNVVVQNFIDMWADALHRAGVPERRIYSHIAFNGQGLTEDTGSLPSGDTAFGVGHRAGFSTYPVPGVFSALHGLVQRHGNAPWASAEGTNVIPNGLPGEATMETYLGRLFNHGAVLVTLFSWGLGPPDNLFRAPTEGPEALTAYRTFLAGKPLREVPAEPFSLTAFRAKLQRLQSQLPAWVARTRRRDDAEAVMKRLDGHLKRGEVSAADAVADEVLTLLSQ